MTNTLHRYGKAESFVDDYIVFSLRPRAKRRARAATRWRHKSALCRLRPNTSHQPGRRPAWRFVAPVEKHQHLRTLGQAPQAELQEGSGRHDQGRHHGGGVRQPRQCRSFVKRIKEEDLAVGQHLVFHRECQECLQERRHPASFHRPIRWASKMSATTRRASRPSCCRPVCGHGMLSINFARR